MSRLAGLAVVALVALLTGFVLAGQVKAQLLTPSNRVARYQALVRSVQDLETTNAQDRSRVASLRSQIDALEAAAAQRSAATQALRDQVSDLRAHAGLVALHGPGVEVALRDGVPDGGSGAGTDYLVGYEDVQDVVNLLFDQGAEAIAVNGRRITPLSSYSGSGGQLVIDQGPPFAAPVKIEAIGDRNRMLAAFDDPTALPNVRAREVQYNLMLSATGEPDVSVPATDASLLTPHVSPA